VVQGVYSLCLGETIFNVLLNIEAVHKDKIWRASLVKQLLFEAVAVLSIVHYYFAAVCCGKPFIVWFQKADVETAKTLIQAY